MAASAPCAQNTWDTASTAIAGHSRTQRTRSLRVRRPREGYARDRGNDRQNHSDKRATL